MIYLLFVISKNILNSFLAQISRKLQSYFSKSAFKSNTSFIHFIWKCNYEKFLKIMFFNDLFHAENGI